VEAFIRFTESHFVQFDITKHRDPLAFVISANLHRRHLTESQRAMIGAKLATMPRDTNQHAKGGPIGLSNADTAKLLNVGERSIKRAKEVVQKGSPELQEKVRKGEVKLGAAVQVLGRDKPDQVKALTELRTTATRVAAARKKADANQDMADLDEFKKKWDGFNPMQRRAFVAIYKEPIRALLKELDEQERMIGKAAA
jgi:hypothetical protein